MKGSRIPLVILAAAAGGAVGYLAFRWIVSQGFYALILPGAGIGFAASWAKNPSRILAVMLGLGALILGAFAEWKFSPFSADPSFGYFLENIFRVDSKITLIMIAAGGAMGWWLPWSAAARGPKARRE